VARADDAYVGQRGKDSSRVIVVRRP
jgi:hypothetical protein